MALLDRDLPWLINEARADPDAAQRLVEALVRRAQALQQQSDELRAEIAVLKRGGASAPGASEQARRLRVSVRDLRRLARRAGLDLDVVSMITFAGQGLHLPAPAPLDQVLPLAVPEGEPVSALKPLCLAAGRRFGSLLAATSAGRFALANGAGLAFSEAWDWRDAALVEDLGLARAERVEAVVAVDEDQPPPGVALVTRQGWARALSWSHVETLAQSSHGLTWPGQGDAPVWIGPLASGASDLLLFTRAGRWTRFPLVALPLTGGQGIALDSGDDVVGAAALSPRDQAVAFVGGDGALCALAAAGLEAHKKPGGKAAPLARRLVGLACFVIRADKSGALLALSNQGEFHVVTLRGVPIAERAADLKLLNVVNARLAAAALL
jgi:hypothetical protein